MKFSTLKSLLFLNENDSGDNRQKILDIAEKLSSAIEKTGNISYFEDVFVLSGEYIFVPKISEDGSYDFENLANSESYSQKENNAEKRLFIGSYSNRDNANDISKKIIDIIFDHLSRMIKTKEELLSIAKSYNLNLSAQQKVKLFEKNPKILNQIIDDDILKVDSVFDFGNRKSVTDSSFNLNEIKDMFKRLYFLHMFFKSNKAREKIIDDFKKEIQKIESDSSFSINVDSEKVEYNSKSLLKYDWIFVKQIEHALHVAVILDQVLDTDEFVPLVYNLPEMIHYKNQIIRIVDKIVAIDEMDVFSTSSWLLDSNHYLDDFFRQLFDLFKILPDEIGKPLNDKVIKWFYGIVKHGTIHPLKKKLLDNYQRLLPSILGKADFKSIEHDTVEYVKNLN